MTPTAELARDRAPGATAAPIGRSMSGPERIKIAERLDELASLEPNWDGYGAKLIDPAALRQASVVLEDLHGWPLREPEIFPVPDGGVQLEWTSGPVELELEFEAGGQSAVFVCDVGHTEQRIDGELPRDSALLRLALVRLAAFQ